MLKVFVADMTHTYVALANGSFPLGAAYVASYLKKVLGDKVEVSIFKYPSDLQESIAKGNHPDIFMFSSYYWNQNLGLAFAEEIKKSNEKTLVVAGGPNISKDRHKQKEFLENNPYIDFYILHEGEIAVAELLCRYIENDYCIDSLKKSAVRQSLSIYEGKLLVGDLIDRIGMKKSKSVNLQSNGPNYSVDTLDEIPSPYTNGMMDKFFDNKLYPLVETNRGCPFFCTFCQQGEDYFNSVAMRSSEKVAEELSYITKKMVKESPGVPLLAIADANFAMFKQDLKTTDYIFQLQKNMGWPKSIGCSTGKNKPGQVIDAVEKVLPDSLIISSSMQSTNLSTLKEIKRSNISLEAYSKVQMEIQSRGLRSMADVILGLPHETKVSHFDALFSLIDSGVQEFTSYQAMVLKSTELEEDLSIKKYGLKTKSRLVPRAIGKYEINKKTINLAEVETIVVSTDTLSFDDYLSSRILHLLAGIYHNSGVFDISDYLLKKHDVKKSEMINVLHQRAEQNESKFQTLIVAFINETKGELFDTEEECFEFYCDNENLERVKKTEIGGNLIWAYIGLSFFRYWEDVVDELIVSLSSLIDIDENIESDLRSYLSGRIVNISVDNIDAAITFEAKTNLIKEFRGVSSADNCFTMKLREEFIRSIAHCRNIYGNNPTGWSQMLAHLRVHTFVRDELVPANCETFAIG